MLYQENEDLGKMITSGKLAKLESDLALQRSLTEEMKKSQSGWLICKLCNWTNYFGEMLTIYCFLSELDELIQELDEDVEGMQGTIYYLQQELRAKSGGSSSNTAAASTSNPALQSSNHEDANFQNEVVNLTVKITDLCAQCQVTHQKKQSSSHQLSLKMEVDEDRTKEVVDNENERTCVNGENSSNSSHSDTERLNHTTLTIANPTNILPSSNSDRTTRTPKVANAKHLELDDPNSSISDSETQLGGDVDPDLLVDEHKRTKCDKDDVNSDQENTSPPPSKRSKVSISNHQQNQLSTDSPLPTNSVEMSISANQNGTVEH